MEAQNEENDEFQYQQQQQQEQYFEQQFYEMDLLSGLQESAEEFHRQFDPMSKLYHNGVQQPVPLGGMKQPESMPTMYDPDYINKSQQQNKAFDKDTQFNKLMLLRRALTDLKMHLSKICQPLEGIFRHKEAFRLKGNANNAKHLQIYNQKQKRERMGLNPHLQQICQIMEFFKGIPEPDFYNMFNEQIHCILKDCEEREFQTKVELSDFGFLVKGIATKAFLESNKLLDLIKDIKNGKEQTQVQEQGQIQSATISQLETLPQTLIQPQLQQQQQFNSQQLK